MQCFMLMSTLCETKNFESFLFKVHIIFSLHISICTDKLVLLHYLPFVNFLVSVLLFALLT